ncbi:hypothetical protein WJX72_000494 [[Myrmecia] bisecta]|uniref:Uncharacterized protein n=1 Tax=[Myrmecia] bisecta TaxID=41462 RepID=A0AAW1Q2B7_9CHLO
MSQLRNQFRASEGRYTYLSERLNGLISFNPSRFTYLTLAQLHDGEEAGRYLIYNVQDMLHICQYGTTDKVPVRSMSFSQPANNTLPVIPTCHAFQSSADGYDLLIGLSTGDVIVASLRGQLQGSAANTKPITFLHYNADGAVDGRSCTSVCWIPKSEGSLFAAAHSSGSLYFYNKGASIAAESRFSMKVGPGKGPTFTVSVPGGGINAIAAAPDGSKVATVSRDGVMRVYETSTSRLVTGFKSYYGGALCIAWSADGRYIAVGGEDDLVTVFGLAERGVVAWCQGHTSWVSHVAFDSWVWQQEDEAEPTGRQIVRTTSGMSASGVDVIYRLGSVGQDCQLMLWDITLTSDGLLASLPTGRDAAELIAAAVPRAEMIFTPPTVQARIHHEPLSDLLFTPEALFTADQGGQVKCWQRPPLMATPAVSLSDGPEADPCAQQQQR